MSLPNAFVTTYSLIHNHKHTMSLHHSPDPDRTLDVREIDGEPFSPIMAALDDLAPDETLLLVNSFEPEPLYNVIEGRGMTYETNEVAADEWHVEIEHA